MKVRSINKLNAKSVEAAKDRFWSDGRSLYLKVADGGRRKSWVFRFVRGGKVTSMGLGAVDAISLREARAKRDELMKLVERGINPLAERRRQGQEQAGKRTFAEAAQAYIAQHKGGWSVSSLGAWARSTRRDAASLAKLKIDEIAVEDVKRCVAPLWDAGCLVAARLTLKRLESVFNYARAHGWTKADNPAAWGVFQYIMPKRPKGEPPRHPALEWRELPPVIAKLRQSVNAGAKLHRFPEQNCINNADENGLEHGLFSWASGLGRIVGRRVGVVAA